MDEGRVGHAVDEGRVGHVVNEGRLGHVVGEGRVGHVVALCASRTRAILVLFWPVCVCQLQWEM